MSLLITTLLSLQLAACVPDRGLPPPLAGWTRTGRDLERGEALVIRAAPGSPAGTRPGASASTPLRVTRSGTYGIALDQPGWIDVHPAGASGSEGAALTSVGHGHGPACSTIRKIVRFRLEPGRYHIRLSGLQRPEARLMVVSGGWEN